MTLNIRLGMSHLESGTDSNGWYVAIEQCLSAFPLFFVETKGAVVWNG